MGKDALVQTVVDGCDSWPAEWASRKNQAGGSGHMTQALYPYDTLFSPIQINRMTVKNRIVMAPMAT